MVAPTHRMTRVAALRLPRKRIVEGGDDGGEKEEEEERRRRLHLPRKSRVVRKIARREEERLTRSSLPITLSVSQLAYLRWG